MRLTAIPPLTISDKARRAVWRVVWVLLYLPTPAPWHRWRSLILRAFGARVGHHVRVYSSARIWAPWNLVMESESCLGPGVDCFNVGKVILHEGATVSQRAFLCTASRDYRDPAFALLIGSITIGPHAWVAAEAFVGPGVQLGARAVAAARAVVTRDVAAGTLVAGNPARVLSTHGAT